MTTETGAHESGRYLMRTSYKQIVTTRHPPMGSWLQHFHGRDNKDLPGTVVVGNANRHPANGFLSASLAPAPVATLLDDQEKSGLLNDTLVVVATEFGRAPKINQNAGRDHHPGAFSAMLAGGGITGGQVHGKTDKIVSSVDVDPVGPIDLNATITYALNFPLKQDVTSPVGRPFKTAHDGTPSESLF